MAHRNLRVNCRLQSIYGVMMPRRRSSGKKRNARRHGIIWISVRRILAALVITSLIMVLALRQIAPPGSAFMLQARIKGDAIKQRWIPMHKISPHIAIAVVAAEDQKFPHHWGFDFNAIRTALRDNQNRRRLRGASTITQQVAKNLFLWPSKSIVRKGLEAYFTLLLEAILPKQRILEIYLNIAQFGPKIYGVDAASHAYFGKPPSALSIREAALLTAVLPNPKKMSVTRPSAYVKKRARHIRHQIKLLGGSRFLDKIQPQP